MATELVLFFLIVGTLLELIVTYVAVTAIAIAIGLFYQSFTFINVAMKWSLAGGCLGILNKAVWIVITLMPLNEALNSREVSRIVPTFTAFGGFLGLVYWRMRVKHRD